MKVTVNSDICKGCGLCVCACPKNIMVLARDKMNAKGYHPAQLADDGKCASCAFCAIMCPDAAITVIKEA